MPSLNKNKGFLFIISGPAGSGKTTICNGLIKKKSIHRIITSTTRTPRHGEINGSDYHFLSPSDFKNKIANNDFYEHAQVHNHHYGTEKKEIISPILEGHHCLLNIDIQGAKTIKDKAILDPTLTGQIVTIFIMPPSLMTLKKRMQSRGTDSNKDIERRLKVAEEEMRQNKFYDHIINSSTKESDLSTMCSIFEKVTAEL